MRILLFPCILVLFLTIILPAGEASRYSAEPAGSSVYNLNSSFPLTLEQRVAYQRAIEQVYWNHRIWPKENPAAKPPLEAVLPEASLRAKVESYLQKSNALAEVWRQPITTAQLQAEMNRMARNSKQPEVLRELFAALGNDPYLIAECLARPVLADRLIHNWYAYDPRFHRALKEQAENELGRYGTAALMRNLSGEYMESEWVRKQGNDAAPERSDPSILTLDAQEWEQWTGDLRARFATAEIPIGILSPLKEDETGFSVATVLEKNAGRIRVAALRWQKQPFDSWWRERKASLVADIASEPAVYTVPVITASACADDSWLPTPVPPPYARIYHTAVWTGSEMIVWGGYAWNNYFDTGSRYDPSTDTWTATSTGPGGKMYHTAVWTGTLMIVWGGLDSSGARFDGGGYDPSTDTWPVLIWTGAPTARYHHTAVWTGTQMIIWGGFDGLSSYLNTGARFDPSTNTWTATSTTGAPTARMTHTAIWTGTRMIVWGGYGNAGAFNTGGRYDPSTNTWTAISTIAAPETRFNHTAVWTGSRMIVWGGSGNAGTLNTGGRYYPSTDTWTATSTTLAPAARAYHTAIWTGTRMIIWGGFDGSSVFDSGGQYDLGADLWMPTSTTAAPTAREFHTAVWTGSEMIVWGGDNGLSYFNTGGRYDPSSNTWTATSAIAAPTGRTYHTAVWTGSEMIVWGGIWYYSGMYYENTGGRYDPSTDSWTATSTIAAPQARFSHEAVWTGSEMIVWGGSNNAGALNTGGRYDPSADSWTATSIIAAPQARLSHTAVWTGSRMIVWGGCTSGSFNTGGRYDPFTDSWTATSTIGAPEARCSHTAVWTGSQMIVWGGSGNAGTLNTGGRYNPGADTWTATSTIAAPQARHWHTAVWTGSKMIVWGGEDASENVFNTGGRYDPSADTWTATSTTNTPPGGSELTAVWIGTQMIVWGGWDESWSALNTGGRYDPSADTWTATSTTNAPPGRAQHSAVWTGSQMIVWGGHSGSSQLDSGGRYCVNVPPVATNDSYSTAEDTPLNIAAPGVLGNDTDANGDTLTAVLVSTTAHGTLTLNSNGSFMYTPSANYNGGDSFTYKVNDSTFDSNVATVSITVTPVNDPPVAGNDSHSTAEDTPLNVAAPGVLGNDTDADGDPLTAALVSTTAHGTLTLNSNGSFTYTPNANYNGSDAFTYKANDGASNSNVATVSITVTPVNDPPVASDQSVSTSANTQVLIVLSATDTEGDPLTYSLVGLPLHGSLLGTLPNLTYTPNAGYTGADSFRFKANDGTSDSNIATVSITVNAPACLYCDDFNDGTLPNWDFLKPAWSETGGNLVATPTRKAIAVATPVFAGCQVCTVEAEVESTGGIGNKIWVYGWYLDKNNTMELLIKEENDKIILRQKAGGRIIKKAAAKIAIAPNISYDFKIEFDGTQFVVSVNSTNMITFLPAGTVPSGTVGFAVKATIGRFGSINVQ